MKKILFVSNETDEKSILEYLNIDSSALHINANNITEFLNHKIGKKFGVFYTSLPDLEIKKESEYNDHFLKLCLEFDEIVYNPTLSARQYPDHGTLFLLGVLSKVKDIKNLPTNDYSGYNFKLLDVRKTDAPQLWVAGCSFTSAVGVKDSDRWGQVLADKLNMEVSFLSRSGSGIRFHIDQLLCSDIRKNDIVILQKSSLYRYDYFPSTTRTPVGENLYHINLQACYPLFETIFPVDRLDEQDQIEKTIRGFVKLQNFCRKVQAKLIIWNHFFDDEPLLSFLRTQEDFVDMPFGDFIDVAEVDKDWPGIMDHPGPKQHQAYADFLYEKLK